MKIPSSCVRNVVHTIVFVRTNNILCVSRHNRITTNWMQHHHQRSCVTIIMTHVRFPVRLTYRKTGTTRTQRERIYLIWSKIAWGAWISLSVTTVGYISFLPHTLIIIKMSFLLLDLHSVCFQIWDEVHVSICLENTE